MPTTVDQLHKLAEDARKKAEEFTEAWVALAHELIQTNEQTTIDQIARWLETRAPWTSVHAGMLRSLATAIRNKEWEPKRT